MQPGDLKKLDIKIPGTEALFTGLVFFIVQSFLYGLE